MTETTTSTFGIVAINSWCLSQILLAGRTFEGLFSIFKILANLFYQNPNFYEAYAFQSSTSLISYITYQPSILRYINLSPRNGKLRINTSI